MPPFIKRRTRRICTDTGVDKDERRKHFNETSTKAEEKHDKETT